MQFIKTAFWVLLAVVIALFTYANIGTYVPINLGTDAQILIRLPFLVIISFLAGSVPMWLLHKATRWSMRRKLDSAERALASVKPAYPPPPPSSTVPGSADEP